MARIRSIKPEIARHEGLYEAERATGFPLRFAWAVLPTACDRAGRFKWRPRSMKPDVLPFDDVDFSAVLDAFLAQGFLVKYRVGTEWYGCIPTFQKHQYVNNRESASEIPSVDEADEVIAAESITSTRGARVSDASATPLYPARGEGKGRELEGKGTVDSSPTASVAEPSPSLFEFPTVGAGGTAWAFTEAHLAEWSGLFPALDIAAEARQALAWVKADPKRRKTSSGMARFLVRWFSRSNDDRRPSRTESRPVSRVPSGGGWQCPHVDRCSNVNTCIAKNGNPAKYPVRQAVSA